ncbi:hypothetical protein [Henriciella pelagia]|uniref:hypothetical protein n=1 Tax=Henriciella pelagia TaxID=1977912 RepID=UPI003515AECC
MSPELQRMMENERNRGQTQEQRGPSTLADDIARERGDAVTEALGAFNATADTSPDEAGKIVSLSERYGLDYLSTRNNRELVEQRAKEDDRQATLQKYPVVREFFRADPSRAAVGSDSVEYYARIAEQYSRPRKSWMETAATVLYNAPGALWAGLGPGTEAAVAGTAQATAETGLNPFAGMRAPTIRNPLDKLRTPDLPIRTPDTGMGAIFQKIRETAAANAAAHGERARGRIDRLMPQVGDETAQGILGGFRSLGQMIPGVALGMATRNPAAATGAISGSVFGQEYGEARSEGVSAGGALVNALTQSGIEYATERLPMQFLIGDAGKPILSRLLRYQSAEQITEQIATHSQDFVDWQLLNPDGTMGDYLSERPMAAYQTMLGTLVAAGGMQSITLGLESLMDRTKADAAEETTDRLNEIRKAVEESPVFTRRKQDIETFINEASEGETVMLDGEEITALYQADGNFRNILREELGLTDDDIQRAMEGSDIEVPASKLLTVSEGYEQLVEIARSDPDAMTMKEVKQAGEDAAASVDMESVQRAMEDDMQAAESFERVQTAVQEQLLNAGRSREESEAAGAIWGAMFRVLEADGIDAGQVFERLNMRVDGGEMARGGFNPNDPEVLTQAADMGYEGSDRGEAAEWLSAARKGLDMSQEARMERARAAGHDALIVENVVDNGSPNSNTPATTTIVFDPSNIRSVNAAFDPDMSDSANLLDQSQPVFFSALQRFIEDAKQPKAPADQWKAMIAKAPGIKAEEIEWTGVNEFLDGWYNSDWPALRMQVSEETLKADPAFTEQEYGKPEPVTKEALVAYLESNGVNVETITATEDGEGSTELDFGEGEVWDDPEAWEPDAEDMAADPESFGLDFQTRAIDEIRADEAEYIRSNMDPDALAEAEADLSGDVVDQWIRENFADEIQQKYEDYALEIAKERYFDNPYYVYRAETNGEDLYIFGNDDIGWDIREGANLHASSINPGGIIYSLSEARIQAEEYAREMGMLDDEGSPTSARWGEYITEGPSSNYRELKLTLPDVEGEFVESAHFDDPNVVAFLRVTDRNLNTGSKKIQPPTRKGRLKVVDNGERVNGDTIVRILFDGEEIRTDRLQAGVTPEETQRRMDAVEEGRFINSNRGAISGRLVSNGDGTWTHEPPVNDADNNTFFVEELQSDWHQQGRQNAYDTAEDQARAEQMKEEAFAEETKYSEQATQALKERSALFDEIFEDNLDPNNFESAGALARARQERFRDGARRLGIGNIDADSVNPMAEFNDLIDAFANVLRRDGTTDFSRTATTERGREIVKRGAELTIKKEDAERAATQARDRRWAVDRKLERAVPNAPFKGDAWINLSIKRALRQAVEDGADAFAWADSNVLKDRWSDRYAELYENLYDRKVSKAVSKLLKAKPKHMTIEGEPYTDSDADRSEQGYWIVELTDEMKQKIMGGFPLFQKERASVQIPGVLSDLPGAQILEDSDTVVRLTTASDKTSFLHESAHIFLELYAALESENPAIAERMADIRKWLKLKPGEALTRDQHEKFAESFEAYLMEGKAPSKELKGVFRQFRSWFAAVYRRLRGQLPSLNAEARAIFDRMLATEDDIALARGEFTLTLQNRMADIMTPEQVEKYRHHAEQAGRVAEERLFRKFVAEIQRKLKADYAKDREQISEQLTEDYSKEGVYRAKADLTTDGFTLKDDVEPDMVATDYGYATGEELVHAIETTPSLEETVGIETQNKLDALYGDMLTDGTAEAEAIEAVFNESSIRAMEAERNAIAEKAAAQPIPLNAIKQRAEERINKLPISEVIKPGIYAIKARTLHRKAIQAAAKGKWDDALRWSHQAMFQHEMARRAFKARSEVETINRQLGRYRPSKFPKKGTEKKMDVAFIKAITNLMSLPGSDGQFDRMAALREFRDKQAAEGVAVPLPLMVELEETMPETRNMTLEQLRDFKDSVKAIARQGRANSAEARAAFTADVQKLAEIIRANYSGKTKRETRNPTWGEKATSRLRELEALFLRYPFLVEALQGGKDGAVVEALEQTLRRQLTLRNQRRDQMGKRLVDIFNRHGITQGELNERISAPAIEAGPVKFEQVLAVALNMGTQSNRDRLASDPSLGDMATLEAMLDQRLEKRHWDAVQDIWNLINTMWPEAKAVEERTTGLTPKKVEAAPVQTRFGTYPGGYMPLSYDRGFLSNKDLENADMKDLWNKSVNGMATNAATNKGFLKERQQNVSRPLQLSLGNIVEHIDDVTNDIYMREETVKISRILRHPAFREALAETHGSEYAKTLETVLKRVVHGSERSQDIIDRIFRTARVNASVAILGLNLRTALLAPISYVQTVVPRIGVKATLNGIASFYSRGTGAGKFIMEKSAFMKERVDTLSREAHERVRNAKGQSGWNKVQGAGYWMMTFVEIWSTSGPTWMGVYNQALAEGKSEADAITDADRAVAVTQGSGLEIDQSILQGGSEFQRALTFMWGYVSGYYGIVRNDIAKEAGYRKAWPIVKHFILLNIAASLLEGVLRMAAEGVDDDDDPYWKAVQDMYWRNIIGMLPGVSLAANRYGGGEAPAIAAGQDMFESFRAWERIAADYAETGEIEGDVAYKATRNTLKAMGIALGVPGTLQIDKAVNTLVVDDDPNAYEIFFSGPDDDN